MTKSDAIIFQGKASDAMVYELDERVRHALLTERLHPEATLYRRAIAAGWEVDELTRIAAKLNVPRDSIEANREHAKPKKRAKVAVSHKATKREPLVLLEA